MDDNLRYYLENTAVTKSEIESQLVHPITGLRYPNRSVYNNLQKYATGFFNGGYEPRLVGLAGLRGVGKTTLLWQMADYIHENHHTDIYFFNVNDLKKMGIDLHIALIEFQRHILKKKFREFSKPITLLFDEVHDNDDWSRTLKILYDEARSAFILCTGSSALLLNSTADLAMRMYIEKIYPFKFTEFITAKTYLENNKNEISFEESLSNELSDALFYSETPQEAFQKIKDIQDNVNIYFDKINSAINVPLKDLLQRYIKFQNIPRVLFFQDTIIITNSILSLLKRVVYEDIPKYKPIFTDFSKIESLILRLAGSDEINTEKLAGIIGVKQQEINELIDILCQAELLNLLLPYGGLDTRILKNKKAFFMSPSLRRALLTTIYKQNLPEHFQSKLIEDIIVMYLKRLLIDNIVSFVKGNNETIPDFVIETRDKPVLLEVGTSKTSIKQIKQSNIDYRYGILVSDGVNAPTLKEDTIQIPLSWFLLL
jgi:predicted AAA+ superfamily ATPase